MIEKEKLIEKEITNMDDFFIFHELIMKNMENKDWYSVPDKQHFQELIDNQKAKMWGYYLDNTLIAVTTAFTCEKQDLEIYGLESLDYRKCIDQGVTAVHPDYRGKKLQAYMTELFFKRYQGLDYEYAIATVHKENRYSLKNLQDLGYDIIKEKSLPYGERYITLKKL